MSDRNRQRFMLSRDISAVECFDRTTLRREILSSQSDLRAAHIDRADTLARLLSDLAGVCFRGL